MARKMISAAVLALALTGAGAAFAQEDAMTVRLGDLNVHSEAGARAALQRIRSTASTWCGGENSRELRIIAAQRACVARMTNRAVDRLDAPMVAALNGSAPTLVFAGGPR